MYTFTINLHGRYLVSTKHYPTSADAENALDEYINLSLSHGFPVVGFVHTI